MGKFWRWREWWFSRNKSERALIFELNSCALWFYISFLLNTEVKFWISVFFLQENSQRFNGSIIVGCWLVHYSRLLHDFFIWNGNYRTHCVCLQFVSWKRLIIPYSGYFNEKWYLLSSNFCDIFYVTILIPPYLMEPFGLIFFRS